MAIRLTYVYLTFLCIIQICFVQSAVEVKNVERTIDLSSQLVKESFKIVAKDSAGNSVSEYIFVIPEVRRQSLAYIAAKDESKRSLKIKEDKLLNQTNFVLQFYSYLPTQNFNIEIAFTKDVFPHPEQITQSEKHLVKYCENLYMFSPYKTVTQKTFVKLSSTNIISHTQVKPFSVTANKLKYGPYENVPEYSIEKLEIHYENNSPFLTVSLLERTIEVSHWGNIAVKESIYMKHTGAKLKGSFSRYEFQKDGRSGQSALKSYKTVLPASATGVYYRDSNGNISTSNMKILRDSVELELRPRFPLFGGWKTHYMLGYNVPSFEYLYNSKEDYILKMRVIDHVYDDMVIDEAIITIILPEGSSNIELKTPYPVKRKIDSLHFTYLDTIGRPVISFSKTNLVENHISEFSLKYNFSAISLLQEPMLVICFIFIIFILTILFMRLDFSITHYHKD